MTKKKVFGVSSTLSKGIRETIHAVENNIGNFRFAIVSLSQVELDPENPRDLHLSKEDVIQGFSKQDPYYDIKKSELDALVSLTESIKLKGIINPIVVYKHLDRYRIVAGERRYLASLYANKQDIQARVLNEKPTLFDLRLLQWIENTEREDLSLKDRIGNVRAIIREYHQSNAQIVMSPTRLKAIMGISLPQATYYYAVVHAKADVSDAIEKGFIKSLDKAAIIANVEDKNIREKLIRACEEGFTLKQLRHLIQTQKSAVPSARKDMHKSDRLIKKIPMGDTSKVKVVKKIIDTMLELPEYQKYIPMFESINWKEIKQTSLAFKKLLKIIERVECDSK